MKFTTSNIENMISVMTKTERYFAYKYQVEKENVALIIKGKAIHVLIDGKVKESITPKHLLVLGIDEQNLSVKKVSPKYKPIHQ